MIAYYDAPYGQITAISGHLSPESKDRLWVALEDDLGASMMEGLENPTNWTVTFDGTVVRFDDAVIDVTTTGNPSFQFGTVTVSHSNESSMVVMRLSRETRCRLTSESAIRVTICNEHDPDIILGIYTVPIQDLINGQVVLDYQQSPQPLNVTVSKVDQFSIVVERVKRMAALIASSAVAIPLPLPPHENMRAMTKVAELDAESGLTVYWIPKKGRKPAHLRIVLHEGGGVKYEGGDNRQLIITACRASNPDYIITSRTFSYEEMATLEEEPLFMQVVGTDHTDIDLYSNFVYRDMYFITRDK